jgi:hypothetical protein
VPYRAHRDHWEIHSRPRGKYLLAAACLELLRLVRNCARFTWKVLVTAVVLVTDVKRWKGRERSFKSALELFTLGMIRYRWCTPSTTALLPLSPWKRPVYFLFFFCAFLENGYTRRCDPNVDWEHLLFHCCFVHFCLLSYISVQSALSSCADS